MVKQTKNTNIKVGAEQLAFVVSIGVVAVPVYVFGYNHGEIFIRVIVGAALAFLIWKASGILLRSFQIIK